MGNEKRQLSADKAKENRKRQIIKAAVQVFSREGYHNARMEEIAQVAGIGKGTIYEYFNSKVELFKEMMERSMQLYFTNMVTEDYASITFADKITLLMETHFRFCQENKELTRLLFWEAEVMDRELKEWAYKFRTEKEAKMQLMIEEGIRQGEIKEVKSKLVTLMIIGFMGSVWMPLVLDNWQIDVNQLAVEATQLIMQGIAVKN
jgi:AcrR family transcriptional regulator